jgi:N-acetylneuraminate lyase
MPPAALFCGHRCALVLTRAPFVQIGVQATCFNKPPSMDSVVDLLAAISAAAPTVPLYYYHIPSKTGVTWRCDELLRTLHPVREARVPTFRGIKYSDSDFHILANCVAFAGGFYDVLSGKDEMLLAALAMGCTGAVGSTYNYQGVLANKIIAAFKAGEMVEAHRLQRILQAGVDLLLEGSKYGPAGVNVGKALMEIRLGGKYVGPPRYPAPAMPAEGKARLRDAAEAAGFFTELA